MCRQLGCIFMVIIFTFILISDFKIGIANAEVGSKKSNKDEILYPYLVVEL